MLHLLHAPHLHWCALAQYVALDGTCVRRPSIYLARKPHISIAMPPPPATVPHNTASQPDVMFIARTIMNNVLYKLYYWCVRVCEIPSTSDMSHTAQATHGRRPIMRSPCRADDDDVSATII